MADREGEDLLEELGLEATPIKASSHTPQEERLLAGFEDILRFVQEHGRAPQHGEDRDIFERLYAVRLDRLRALTSAHALLMPLDSQGLLSAPPSLAAPDAADDLDDAALLAELGLGGDENDITQLRHVRSFEERKSADDIANRTPCTDFDRFEPLFERVEGDIKTGLRKTLRFGRDASVAEGNFFILGGQMAYVAEVGRPSARPMAKLMPGCASSTQTAPKATCCNAHCNEPFTRTIPAGASPMTMLALSLATHWSQTISSTAPSMCCVACPTIPSWLSIAS